ncbi:hypothetical protein JCM1841_006399 [Sporobolomyces salmonicolor]
MLAACRSISARSGSSCRSAVAARRFLHQQPAESPFAAPSTSAEPPQSQSLDDRLAALNALRGAISAPVADIHLKLPALQNAIDFLVQERQAEVQYKKDMLDYEASFRFYKSEFPLPSSFHSSSAHSFPLAGQEHRQSVLLFAPVSSSSLPDPLLPSAVHELAPLLALSELPPDHTLAGLHAPEVTHIFNLISNPPYRTALALAIEAWASKEALRPQRKYLDRPVLTKAELEEWVSRKAKVIVRKQLITEKRLDGKELAKLVDGIVEDYGKELAGER